jgi:hypothetical protein
LNELEFGKNPQLLSSFRRLDYTIYFLLGPTVNLTTGSSVVQHSGIMTAQPIENPEVQTSPGPFEGPEKLLELWFAPSPDDLPGSSSSSGSSIHGRSEGSSSTSNSTTGGQRSAMKGLRKVPRKVWEEMLDIVKCKVLSFVEGDEVDAYLLR